MYESVVATYMLTVAWLAAYEQMLIATIAVASLLGVAAYMLLPWRKKTRRLLHRGNIMGSLTKKEEDLILRNEIGMVLTDFLEDKFLEGKISSATATLYYRRFANILSIPDLLPRNHLVLKERIKKDLANKEVLYKPVPIPGPGPLKEVKKNTFKSSLAELLMRHAA